MELHYIWLLAFERRNSSKQSDGEAEEASRPAEAAPKSDLMENEDYDEGEAYETLKRPL